MQNMDKQKIKNIILVVIGSLIVAFANSLFIVPFEIVKGGMTSIAMMINSLLYPLTQTNLTDVILWILNIILWFVALLIIGKKFAMSTLVGTICYSLFITLFTRIDLVSKVGLMDYYNEGDTTAKLILFGLAGGVIDGFGASLCFIGKGSTGGSDVLSVSCVKYLNMKQEIASLFINVITIILGFVVFQSWGKLLVGIVTALTSSLMVKNTYGKYNTLYVLDILTDKVEELQNLISLEFNETSTIYSVEGGYSKNNKKVIRTVLIYKEAKLLKAILPNIDKNAFVTEYETTHAFGGSINDAYIREKTKDELLNKFEEDKKK